MSISLIFEKEFNALAKIFVVSGNNVGSFGKTFASSWSKQPVYIH